MYTDLLNNWDETADPADYLPTLAQALDLLDDQPTTDED